MYIFMVGGNVGLSSQIAPQQCWPSRGWQHVVPEVDLRGMYITFASAKQIRQNSLWLWNPEETSPELPKQGYQWPQNRTPNINFKQNVFMVRTTSSMVVVADFTRFITRITVVLIAASSFNAISRTHGTLRPITPITNLVEITRWHKVTREANWKMALCHLFVSGWKH